MSWKRLGLILAAPLPVLLALISALPVAASTNYNNLIDDVLFDNYGTMSAAQIDAFLNSFPNSCLSTNNGFTASDPTGYTPTASSINGIYSYGSAVTAGHVIYDAALSHHVNPQVILATLEKEETLVSGGSGCATWRYASALGFGCPDSQTLHNYSYPHGGMLTPLYYHNGSPVNSITNSCVNRADLVGFSEQVIHFAWLMSFSQHRAEGQSTFAITSSAWNHCDDNDTCPANLNIPANWACYSGYMTMGTWKRCSGGSATFYDGTATIDGSSIHIENGATAALYVHTPHKAGNNTFDTLFISWFGTIRGTPFIRVGSTAPVYVLGDSNNYYHVASSQVLTEYGYGTVFKTVDSVISSYLTGLTNSGDLPPIARFEDDNIFLVDRGTLHLFASPAQLNSFGYSVGQEATLPSWMEDRLTTGSGMQAVVKQTGAPEIYYVSNDKKSHITSRAAYNALGSPAYSSQASVTLSSAYVGTIPLGAPILVANSFVHTSDTNTYGFWDGTGLQTVSTTEATASGVTPDYSAPAVAINQLPASSNPSVGNLAKSSSGSLYILDTGQKFSVDPSQLTSLNLSAPSFVIASDGWLARFSTKPMTTLLRPAGTAPIYSIIEGMLYHISSGTDFTRLGYHSSDVLSVNSATKGLFATSSTELFAPGHLVRIGNTPAIYLIDTTFTKHWITSSAVFNGFGFMSSAVTSVTTGALAGYSAAADLKQIVKDGSGNFWLVDLRMKHKLSPTLLGAGYYNVNQGATALLADVILNNVSTSSDATNLIQASKQTKVYRIEDGQKRWFTTAASFRNSGASRANIMTVSPTYLASLPNGAPIH